MAGGSDDTMMRHAAAAGEAPSLALADARPPRIALCAGEASGDLLGAGLVAELAARFPGAEFAGVGGARMREAGVETWHDASELAVMGLSEVLRHLPRLLGLRRRLRRRLLDWRPDVFIGIDAPDFNLGLERWLKRRGVRTVHYVSPSVWAWRQGRAAKIGRSADLVLCLFPMEPPIYARHGVDARFVGHPMADAMPLNPDRRRARAELGLDDEGPVLAVLPGSRLGEIERLGAVFLDAAGRVARAVPGLRILVPAATPACGEAIRALLAAAPPPRAASACSRAARARRSPPPTWSCSRPGPRPGNHAGEAADGGRLPIAPTTYRIVRSRCSRWTATRCRTFRRRTIAPELMQEDCTPERLAGRSCSGSRPAATAALEPVYRDLHTPCAATPLPPPPAVAGLLEAPR